MQPYAPSSQTRRLEQLILIGGVLAFGMFFLLNCFAEFEISDDILLLGRAWKQSVAEIFTSSYLTDMHVFFYRPLPTLLTKAMLTDSLVVLPFRLAQAALAILVAALLLLYVRGRGVSRVGMGALLLLLVSSPFLRAAFMWWGDSTTLLSLVFFSASLLLIQRGKVNIVAAAVLTALALLSKELGIVVGLMFAYHFFRRKSYGNVAAIGVVLAAYFALRHVALGAALPHGTAVWTYESGMLLLSPQQTREFFGDSPYLYYVYNVLAEGLSLLFWQPFEGMIRWHPARNIALTVLQSFSTFLIIAAARRKMITVSALYLLIAIVNIAISYRYTNVRHIPLAATVWVLLFVQAADAFWRFQGRVWKIPARGVVVTLLLGWAAFLGLVLADAYHYTRIQGDVYRAQEEFGRLDLMPDAHVFDIVRSRYVKEDSSAPAVQP